MPAVELTPTLHAERSPHAPAIIMSSSGEITTYRELEDRSRRFANALRMRGLGFGDHIAVLMDNNREYLEVTWAAQRSGLYYTAVNSHLRRAEVQYILDDCGAKALVTSEGMSEVVSDLDLSRIPIRVCVTGELAGFESYSEALSAEPPSLEDEREGREMLYSSGTTGRPKGVRKTLSGTALGDPSAPPVQIAQGIAALGGGPGAVYLSPAPLYHSAPLVYSMSMHRLGATVVVMEHFDPRECLKSIERYGVTHAQFVPTMFVRMLHLPKEERDSYDLSSLKFAVHAAAPCPVPVKRQMLDWWGPIIYEYYAGTEDIGSASITPQEWLQHPGSVGKPRDECHILGEDGGALPPVDVAVIGVPDEEMGKRLKRLSSPPTELQPVRRSRRSCWSTAGRSWRLTSALRASTSSTSYREIPTASCTRDCCGNATGKATALSCSNGRVLLGGEPQRSVEPNVLTDPGRYPTLTATSILVTLADRGPGRTAN